MSSRHIPFGDLGIDFNEVQKAFTDPDIVKRLDDTGFEVIVSRPDIFAKFSEDDVQSMKDLARKIGLNKK